MAFIYSLVVIKHIGNVYRLTVYNIETQCWVVRHFLILSIDNGLTNFIEVQYTVVLMPECLQLIIYKYIRLVDFDIIEMES